MIFKTEDKLFLELEKLDFSLTTWLKYWYPAICDFLSISPKSDLNAVKEINSLFEINSRNKEKELINQLKGKIAIIVAPGNSLSKEVAKKVRKMLIDNTNAVLIAVDGATSFLLENGLNPGIIISDLDGCVEDQIKAQKSGSILIVHIHGDNVDQAKRYLPKITKTGHFLFSTQSEELGGFRNFLGFTDGDRAVCFSANYSIKEVILFGYDFGKEIGKYSKVKTITKEKRTKKFKKFIIAKSVINWCSKVIKISMQE